MHVINLKFNIKNIFTLFFILIGNRYNLTLNLF